MTTTAAPTTAPTVPSAVPSTVRTVIRFVLHYAEMVVAMTVGMFVLAPLWTLLWPGGSALFEAHLLVMATDMAIGMVAVMLVRRHSWPGIVEMTASMYVAFLAVLVPYWFGVFSAGAVMLWGHVLMLVLMLAVMLRRGAAHGVHS